MEVLRRFKAAADWEAEMTDPTPVSKYEKLVSSLKDKLDQVPIMEDEYENAE